MPQSAFSFRIVELLLLMVDAMRRSGVWYRYSTSVGVSITKLIEMYLNTWRTHFPNRIVISY